MIEVGQRYGRLTIVERADIGLAVPGGWWTAECVCGRRVTALAEGFTARRITSCGRPTPQQRAEQEAQLAATRTPFRL
jgi:hypothetical protein